MKVISRILLPKINRFVLDIDYQLSLYTLLYTIFYWKISTHRWNVASSSLAKHQYLIQVHVFSNNN